MRPTAAIAEPAVARSGPRRGPEAPSPTQGVGELDCPCARQSLAREERRNRCHLETRDWSPAGSNPARPKPSQQAGSESCVVPGRPGLRSVDSERMGRVSQPRKESVVDADGVGKPEGSTGATAKARFRRSTGVKEQGTFAEGLPRNLGGPVVFTLKPVTGTSRPTPGRWASRPIAHRSKPGTRRDTAPRGKTGAAAGRTAGSRSARV